MNTGHSLAKESLDVKELARSFTIGAGSVAVNRASCRFIFNMQNSEKYLKLGKILPKKTVPGGKITFSNYVYPLHLVHPIRPYTTYTWAWTMDIPKQDNLAASCLPKLTKYSAFTCVQHSDFCYLDFQGGKVQEPWKETSLLCCARWEGD